ncbi:unnamed protein product [Lampetra fluviatilis]
MVVVVPLMLLLNEDAAAAAELDLRPDGSRPPGVGQEHGLALHTYTRHGMRPRGGRDRETARGNGESRCQKRTGFCPRSSSVGNSGCGRGRDAL